MKQIALALLLAVPAFAQLAEGDQHWAARAEGHTGGRAAAQHIDAAIAAYQRAVAQSPNDLEARWKLLRAYRFKGAYVASTADDKKKVYGEAKKVGDAALSVVNQRLGVTGKSTEKQVADAARNVPGAAEVYLWDAVNWGEWALAYGKLAAAREGAADRIRRQATIANLVDPRLDGGTPSRVLGRLHDQTPRIPFITGWASGKEAIKFLRQSLEVDASSKITRVFMAEAMVAEDSKTKASAIEMLRGVINSPNNPQFVVEESAATDDARALLRKLSG